jgi:squalene-hopene/tetraprenyl-beta-curcumene cyclase
MRRVAAVLALAAAACGRPTTDRDSVLRHAAEYLWSRQGPDGGWHSETYGLLKSGQSLTPFILGALLDVPEVVCPRPAGGVDRVLAFIRRHLDAEGALGRADPALDDYPNYATSLAIRAFVRSGRTEDVPRMVACLRKQQFAEHLGWTEDHPAYGAWGMGGPLRRPPHTGHLDLSMTRHVLEALRDGGVPPDDPAFRKAEVFLERCRNPDGGFFFSTVIVDANKAGKGGGTWRSYGTTTADGILAHLAVGARPDDSRVSAARAWLAGRHRADRVPGFPDGLEQDWRTGMYFYYAAGAARAFHALSAPGWRDGLIEALAARRRPDGSFRNASFLMKEDDPLIATTFSVMALAAARN